MTHGGFSTGGIWVRGLCADCNSLAGGRSDAPYADFAAGITRWHNRDTRIQLPNSADVPAVSVKLVPIARSILYGMHAVSPRLRFLFPVPAASLASGDDQVPIPPGLRLRVAHYTELHAGRWPAPCKASPWLLASIHYVC